MTILDCCISLKIIKKKNLLGVVDMRHLLLICTETQVLQILSENNVLNFLTQSRTMEWHSFFCSVVGAEQHSEKRER